MTKTKLCEYTSVSDSSGTYPGGKGVFFIYFLLSLMYLMLFMFSQDDHVKKETECSETSGTSQGRTIKRKTRSLIFQRRGAEHTLDVFALADLD